MRKAQSKPKKPSACIQFCRRTFIPVQHKRSRTTVSSIKNKSIVSRTREVFLSGDFFG